MAHPNSLPRLVIAGASGPIGRAIHRAARDRYDVTVLTRRLNGSEPDGARARAWNPTAARDHDNEALADLAEAIAGADALVNLAGSSIDGRFGPEHRASLLSSRLTATETLVHAAALAPRAPRVWLQGSAVGIYGDRGDEELNDRSAPGSGTFMTEIVQAWEAAAQPAAERSRQVVLRIGMALGPEAEAWQRLLLPSRLGAGGPLGSGRQRWPWIHVDDLARAALFLIEE
ncbi:MAG: NAD-dependent epimerase/dehydratase family protein, partial [Trueperaceae bacterium]